MGANVITSKQINDSINEINDVFFKGKEFSKKYFGSWSVLLQTNVFLSLPISLIIEANNLIKSKIITSEGRINWVAANGLITDNSF